MLCAYVRESLRGLCALCVCVREKFRIVILWIVSLPHWSEESLVRVAAGVYLYQGVYCIG